MTVLLPHRTTGEAVGVSETALDVYRDLVTEAEAHRDQAEEARGRSHQFTQEAEDHENEARRLLQQAAELVPPDVLVTVGALVTWRAPGRRMARSVNRDGIERHGEALPAGCLPKEVTTRKWPTVKDIDDHAYQLARRGIPVTDLVDTPPPPPDTVKIERTR